MIIDQMISEISFLPNETTESLFVLIHTGEAGFSFYLPSTPSSSPKAPTSQLTSCAEVNECFVSVISGRSVSG